MEIVEEMGYAEPMRSAAAALIATLILGALPSIARADDDGRRDAQADYETNWGSPFYTTVDPNPPKREIPDYDGRGDDPVSFEEGLLWVPRLLFLPAYFGVERGIRQPLGNLVTRAEEEEIPAKLIDAFRFGPKQQFIIYPTYSFDFGLRSTIGLISRFGDLPAKNMQLYASGAFGGLPWITGTVGTTYAKPGAKWDLDVHLNATRRRDGLFFGLGDEVSDNNEASYNWVGYDAAVSLNSEPWRRTRLSVGTGYRNRQFGDDVGDGTTTIPDLVADGRISALPPAFAEGYSAWFLDTRLTFDTRKPRPDSTSGVRFSIGMNLGVDPSRGGSDSAWVVYGGSVTGFWDVSGAHHVLSLQLTTVFSDALRGDVPFLEQPALSGNGPLSGFVARRLAGDSAAALSLNYNWPIWIYLDGKMHVAVGNVFSGHLDTFDFKDLRLSAGIGLAAVGSSTELFEILIGFGTDTFGNGPSIESVRFLFGASRDF